MNAPHFVVGHRNPDTDAIVAATVHAWDLLRQGEKAVQALRLGEANRQTTWLFAEAGVALPPLRRSCRYAAGEMARPAPTVARTAPLRRALDLLRQGRRDFVVVLDAHGHPCGVVSESLPRLSYLLQCNVEDFFGTLLDFAGLVGGLPLYALSSELPPEAIAVDNLYVLWHASDRAKPSWTDRSLVVLGADPAILEALQESPPAAVVWVDVAEAEARSLSAGLDVPTYWYSGSPAGFFSRLSGCLPVTAAMEETFSQLPSDASAEEVENALRTGRGPVVLVTEDGQFAGAVSAEDLLQLKAPRLSLVDHCERGQSIEGLATAEIVEIIDHHRLGDIETIAPLSIDVRPLGSTASVLYARMLERGAPPDPPIAKLLLGALISDTLLLRSPTTTVRDRDFAATLAELADVSLEAFGLEVLRQNDVTRDATAEVLVTRDLKAFHFEKETFLLCQIETVDLDGLSEERWKEIGVALEGRLLAQGARFGVAMVTDVLKGESQMLASSRESLWLKRILPEGTARGETRWRAPGFVSRKKQLLPYILNRLQANGHG